MLLSKICAESQLAVAPQDLQGTVLALLHAAPLLEFDKSAQQIQESNQIVGSSPVRKYFLKRNFAGEGLGCI